MDCIGLYNVGYPRFIQAFTWGLGCGDIAPIMENHKEKRAIKWKLCLYRGCISFGGFSNFGGSFIGDMYRHKGLRMRTCRY